MSKNLINFDDMEIKLGEDGICSSKSLLKNYGIIEFRKLLILVVEDYIRSPVTENINFFEPCVVATLWHTYFRMNNRKEKVGFGYYSTYQTL